MIGHRPANNVEFDRFLSGAATALNRAACPELYFSAMAWHLSINACRSASLLKVGSIDCIPPPEQFVEFISGPPPPSPQLINTALRAIITIYLEFIKLFLFKNHQYGADSSP